MPSLGIVQALIDAQSDEAADFPAGLLSADAAGRGLMAAGYFDASTLEAKFAAGAIAATATSRAKIATGFFDLATVADKLAAGSIATAQLAVGILSADASGRALMATDLFDATTFAAKVAAGAIGVGKLGTGAISASGMFAASVVDAAAIGTGSVTSGKLGANAVIAGKLADGAVDTAARFSALVVDTAALGNNQVTDGKLAAAVQNVLPDRLRASSMVVVSRALATGTTQPVSLTDATFSGKVAGGATNGAGTSGVVAGSFATSVAETSTGAAQAGLGAAAAADRPYPVADFPGQNKIVCRLLKADGDQPVLIDMLSTATGADMNAQVYGYAAYRSDLGADLKWRLWYYYRRASDGLEVPFTPDTSLTSATLLVPEVFLLKDLPVAHGVGQTAVGSQAAAAVGAGSIRDTELASNAVTSAKILAGAVIAGKYGAASIATADVADDAITAAKLRDDAATDANRAVTTDHLRDLAVTSAKVAANAIVAGKLADASIDTSARFAAGVINTAALANDAVDATKLKDDAVTDSNRAVTTDHIRDLAITSGKIAALAVTAGKYAAGSITTADLAAGVLAATAAGRALMATNFFDAPTADTAFGAATIAPEKLSSWSASATGLIAVGAFTLKAGGTGNLNLDCTGAAADIHFRPGGGSTSYWILDQAGNLTFAGDNTQSFGSATGAVKDIYIGSYIDHAEVASAPATPAAARVRVYPDAPARWWSKNDGGFLRPLDAFVSAMAKPWGVVADDPNTDLYTKFGPLADNGGSSGTSTQINTYALPGKRRESTVGTASWVYIGKVDRAWKPRFIGLVRTEAVNTGGSRRVFVGLTISSSVQLATLRPAQMYVGFVYDPADSANWKVISRNTADSTAIDTGIAWAVDKNMVFEIELDSTGAQIRMYDVTGTGWGAGAHVYQGTSTDQIPANGNEMEGSAGAYSSDATVAQLTVFSLGVECAGFGY